MSTGILIAPPSGFECRALVYRTAALGDLADIAAYIERESKSRAVAEAFIDQLAEFCEHLATLPGLMGRDRSEFRPGYRSTVYGNYVIFLRYADEDGPRSHLYVVNVIHGARDIDAVFTGDPDDGGA